ncbi:hypothetical protein ANME2D_01243 [Candidatus Methanoperedens nitroreducens]|uniref:DUF7982 domain-containing protein n=1 Tax=Candidatus Methanoperedens nitratireducens TaxID=1392998 RepID=A0A062V8A5_9EURY|nr:hypothetical protein [Candidatus Methanoperedens nitroreducens]KCZ72808.1 hypothetical protein ANME2D_01243 [Candidatus Methanoperedens nitroreducens]MDJ1423262.1 hypothetical protein [Candidatus Methanoperedens sp.]
MEDALLKRRLIELERENKTLRVEHSLAKKNEYRYTGYALVFFGAAAAAISYFTYNNTTLASIMLFAGLGTVYLGILSLFLTPEKFIREEILERSNLSSIIVINNIIQELQIYSKGIYVLSDDEIRVVIPLRSDYKLKKTFQRTFQVDEPGSTALVLVPLGYSLMQMAEKNGADWNSIQHALDEVMVDGLEVAKGVEVEHGDADITVRVDKPLYINLCRRVSSEAPGICNIGCSFCSLIACIITKNTGKNVMIKQVEHGKDHVTAKFQLVPDIHP